MKTYSAAVVAIALVVLSSATGCGRNPGPLPPSPVPGNDGGTLTLSGRVLDASMSDEEVGLSDALVTVSRESESQSTVTAADGSFQFSGLTAGEWMLTVSREGYYESSQLVQLESDSSVTCFVDRESDAVPTSVRKARFVTIKKAGSGSR
jgi:hypothetical protein